MALPHVTIRSLAASLRLSRATVSAALRGTGRVAASTKHRVLEAAKKMGYRHNPLAGAVMSVLRRSRAGTFRGVIAAVELLEPDRPGHGPFHSELLLGARERCTRFGFRLEHFGVGRAGLPMTRLNRILHSRGIHGLLLLPTWHTANFSGLSWDRYAGIYTDYNLAEPNLHSICSDPYGVMKMALQRLHYLGYRRPGLMIDHERNERLHRRHTAAFHAFYPPAEHGKAVPALVTRELTRREFESWFRRYRPDVVLCHFTHVIDWMESCGARVPATHGFVCLNFINQQRPCASLDLQPREIGARGCELLIGQLHNNARGIPLQAARTTILPRWQEGPTVRPMRTKSTRLKTLQVKTAINIEDRSG